MIVYQSLADLIKARNIRFNWNWALIGDGSGTTQEQPCGWASTVIDPDGQRFVVQGCMTCGTNNVAEIMAYLQPMLLIERLATDDQKNIWVITDSQYVANGLNGMTRASSNLSLWAALDSYRQSGFRFYATHIDRLTCQLNVLADALASSNRKMALESAKAVATRSEALYELTP